MRFFQARRLGRLRSPTVWGMRHQVRSVQWVTTEDWKCWREYVTIVGWTRTRRTLGFCSSWEVQCLTLSLAIDESFVLSMIVEAMLTEIECWLLRMRRGYAHKGAGRKGAGKNIPLKQGSAPWSFSGRATQSHAVVTVGRRMIGRKVVRDRENWTPKNNKP